MKKTALLALGLTMMFGTYTVAQDEKPAAEAKPAAATKPAAPPVENPCKGKVQIMDLSGTQQGGGALFDYFLSIKNMNPQQIVLDVKFSPVEKFPGGTHLYGKEMHDVKIKAGKTQTVRIGNGTSSSFSIASVRVQVDTDKEAKKGPSISLMNCREKK